jgi:hypothetical protein
MVFRRLARLDCRGVLIHRALAGHDSFLVEVGVAAILLGVS